MSAFICDNKYFNLLVNSVDHNFSYYYNGKRHFLNQDYSKEELGQKLLDENHCSVNDRYNENDNGRFDYHIQNEINPVDVLRACDCLEYQSCECDDYFESEGYKILDAIRRYNIHRLPGYKDSKY